MQAFVENFWAIFLLSAPWLLFGLFVAAMMKVWVPMGWLQNHLGDNSAKSVIKGAIFGAPLPLCSCGVIPTAMQLRRNGASKGATVSFLSATPETGVDSISVSYALLGPVFAVVRPVAAILSAITAGLLVGKTDAARGPAVDENSSSEAPAKSSCCITATTDTSDQPTVTSKPSCCSSKAEDKVMKKGFWATTYEGLQYSAGKLLSDFYLTLLIGLFFAALVQTLVPMDTLAQYGGSIWMMLLMVLISVPMYVCATSSTPIAAALMLMGVSPGAALVFMQAGPATNIATIGVVYNELGKRALGAYLFGVIVMSVLFGWLFDQALNLFDINIQSAIAHQHSVVPYWLELGSAILLIVLILRLLVKRFQKPNSERPRLLSD